MQARCSKCKTEKPAESFYKSKKNLNGLHNYCKQCSHEATKVASARMRERRKLQVMLHYSNNTLACGCCGEAHMEFLTIDHIAGGGTKHRKEVGNRIYDWLVINKMPGGYQVLCFNCNWAVRTGKTCPHKKVLKIVTPQE